MQLYPSLTIPRRSRFLALVLLLAIVVTVLHFTQDINYFPHPEFPSPFEQDTGVINEAGKVLLVSAYFPKGRTRHDFDDFTRKLSRFLGQITTDVYFYTSAELAPTIQSLRGSLPIQINTTFEDPFDIPPLRSRRIDPPITANDTPAKAGNSTQTYKALSNAKPFFLAEATRVSETHGPASYKYAFWVDADSFDDGHGYRYWPSFSRLEEVWIDGRRESGARLEDMMFIPMWDLPKVDYLLWKEERGPIDQEFSQDFLFGGMSKGILNFERFYYAYLDHYLDLGFELARHGEALMNSLLLLRPENYITVWHGDPASPSAVYDPAKSFRNETDLVLGDCGNSRHYSQFFLASATEQVVSRGIWNAAWDWKFWDLVRWTRVRETCRLTNVLAVQWTLRRRFGEMWRSPEQSVSF